VRSICRVFLAKEESGISSSEQAKEKEETQEKMNESALIIKIVVMGAL
jgi:hypothetical protein